MRVHAERVVEVEQSFRVGKALGLFNVIPEQAQTFTIDADVPLEDTEWRIGVVYGPSGSGKSTIAAAIREKGWSEWGGEHDWDPDQAIIDCIAPDGTFDEATAALASVGLGTVPTWLRPYRVLSNGERFRADLAHLLASGASDVYVDEFTSVVDRRVACIGAQAFAKSWRRGGPRRVILLTPHFDVLAWIKPDWVLKTSLAGVTTISEGDLVRPEVDRQAYSEAPVVAEVVS